MGLHSAAVILSSAVQAAVQSMQVLHRSPSRDVKAFATLKSLKSKIEMQILREGRNNVVSGALKTHYFYQVQVVRR